MNQRKALEILTSSAETLKARFGVVGLSLFGSTARDEASEESDVDLLVSFSGQATSKQYFGVQFYLEDLMGADIDLVTVKALRPELKPYVLSEKIDVI